MRRLLLISLMCLAGCQSLVTPLEPRRPERADDPLLTPAEQQRRARALYAYPDDELGPRSGVERQNPIKPSYP